MNLAKSIRGRGARYLARARDARDAPDILTVVYDINRMPVSFDICWFLIAADIERRRASLTRMRLVVPPFLERYVHPKPPDHPDYVSAESIDWRIDNILLAVAKLLPTCSGVHLCSSMREAENLIRGSRNVWPAARLRAPSPIRLQDAYRGVIEGLEPNSSESGFRAPAQGLKYVQQWASAIAGRRRLIVITLRQHRGGALRNNDLAAWIAFAHRLDKNSYCPVFVPDTDHALDPPGELAAFASLNEAAWNMSLRLSLYEAAYMNMFVNNGPASLCILDPRCRYLMFKVMVPSVPLASAETLRDLGFTISATPRFATPFQKWVWENDRLETIEAEFAQMCAVIDRANPFTSEPLLR